MFTVEARDRALAHLLRSAEDDPRIVAAALVGSSADGGDRWSDVDLTLGVAEDAAVEPVLGDWTRDIERSLGALQLFDLQAGPSIYRVFLLPGCLQVDVSFTPAPHFGATSPRFKLLFGSAIQHAQPGPRDPRDLYGLGAHHAVRCRICIERGRLLQAEYWLGALRNEALSLACLNRGLPAAHGRGFDDLPTDVRATPALPTSLAPSELARALAAATELLCAEAGPLAEPLAAELRRLADE